MAKLVRTLSATPGRRRRRQFDQAVRQTNWNVFFISIDPSYVVGAELRG